MDIQLQELIGKIKKDGIESAGKEAEQVKAQAQTDAARIVEDAKKEAARIVSDAKLEAERAEKAGIAAVEQASRNTILSFKSELEALFDKIIKDDVVKAYDASLIAKAIPEVLKAWAGGKEGGVDVILSEKDLSAVEAACKGQLQEAVKGGAEFKTARGIEAGFHVALKDGSAYYDFSADQIANALAAYLNPKLAETLKNAAKAENQ